MRLHEDPSPSGSASLPEDGKIEQLQHKKIVFCDQVPCMSETSTNCSNSTSIPHSIESTRTSCSNKHTLSTSHNRRSPAPFSLSLSCLLIGWLSLSPGASWHTPILIPPLAMLRPEQAGRARARALSLSAQVPTLAFSPSAFRRITIVEFRRSPSRPLCLPSTVLAGFQSLVNASHQLDSMSKNYYKFNVKKKKCCLFAWFIWPSLMSLRNPRKRQSS